VRLGSSGADLVIRDGVDERLSALTAEDLATGTAFYTPRGGDIVFILRAKAAGRPGIEERIRVIGAIVPAVSNHAPQGTLRVPTAPVLQSPVQQPPERRAFVPPSRTESPKPATLPAPPVLGVGTPVNGPNIPSSTLAPAPPPPAAPHNAAPTPSPAASRPSTTPISAPIAEPPAVTHQTAVVWPRFAPRTGTFEVKLRVEVDANGDVTKLTALNRSTENVMFVQSALESVRSWKFRPAFSNGHSVRGEVELTVHFHQ
jgi:protein TonB